MHAPGIAEERFWYRTLEGEVALARGDLPRARAAFAAAEPAKPIFFKMQRGWLPTLVNSLSYRDGAARAAKAQGNLGEAIQLYRRLLVYGPESKFISVVEPRYVLELARLLEKTGDRGNALKEYERFLDFWKQADPGLPELAEARRAVDRLRGSICVDWSLVKELFNAALDREPAARAAFLHASCDDAAVRSEVERLLAAHEEAGEFIERSPVAVAGRVIDHYKIEWSIGAGGMGEVYRARDLELGREVAIKIALGGDADSQARLKREAQHASQLNHPNICTIHEVGESGGAPFIVMELVDGDRLADLISRGTGLQGPEIVRYGLQMAAALEHAHQHGVIHRDLKSANVMVTRDGRIKVLDFGLARRHSSDQLRGLTESRETIAVPGVVAGTLSAMAPELLRGGTADARSDIWALGVLLYEMAAGTLPFAGATGFELSGAILHEPPAPLRASIPDPLRGIIARCLEKNPAARYQSASDIRVALEGVPVETPDAGEVRRALEPSAWHKVSVPGVARDRRCSSSCRAGGVTGLCSGALAPHSPVTRRRGICRIRGSSTVTSVKSFDGCRPRPTAPELAWLWRRAVRRC